MITSMKIPVYVMEMEVEDSITLLCLIDTPAEIPAILDGLSDKRLTYQYNDPEGDSDDWFHDFLNPRAVIETVFTQRNIDIKAHKDELNEMEVDMSRWDRNHIGRLFRSSQLPLPHVMIYFESPIIDKWAEEKVNRGLEGEVK